ncbi:MAG TPA: SemiSWEET transporter [Psychromonas sp.]
MFNINMLGYVAALCTTLSFIPQVLYILKTKDTSSISLGMYAILVFGVFCWLAYGGLKNDIPLLLANLVTFILAGMILILKVRS